MDSAFLLNRMMEALAARVRKLVQGAFDVELHEVDDCDALPLDGNDLLVVGRQHHLADGTLRYGYDLLAEAIDRNHPAAVIYVFPNAIDPKAHGPDLDAMGEAAHKVPVYALEFSVLHTLELPRAIDYARRALAQPVEERGQWSTLLPAASKPRP